MLQNIGSTEIIIICIILLILFGGKKIPEFIRSLGQSVREFRSAVKSNDKEKDE